jgi:phosphatidate cytidylyltransferase
MSLPPRFWTACAVVLGLVALGAAASLLVGLRRLGPAEARASLGPRTLVWAAVAVVLLACAGAGVPAWTALLALVAALAARELAAALRAAGGPADGLAAALGAAALVAAAPAPRPWGLLLALAAAAAALVLAPARGGRAALLPTAAAVAYVGGPLALLAALRGRDQGFALVLWTVVAVVLTDVAAMLGGMAFGRTPMAPRISPKKTWEGSAAGLIGAVAGAGAVAVAFRAPPQAGYLLAAAALGAAGIAGDLAASRIKRAAGLKDFGGALPGHGGVMDRIDGLLWAAPVAWLLAGLAAP